MLKTRKWIIKSERIKNEYLIAKRFIIRPRFYRLLPKYAYAIVSYEHNLTTKQEYYLDSQGYEGWWVDLKFKLKVYKAKLIGRIWRIFFKGEEDPF